MEHKKNFSKGIEILIHILFWFSVISFFVNVSIVRPIAPFWKESIVVVLLALVCYLNYFILYPYLFKRNRLVYFFVVILSISAITVIEMLVVIPDIKKCFSHSPNVDLFIKGVYLFVFLRNISFVAFFVILKLYDDAIARYRLEKEKLLLLHEKRRIELDNLKSKIAPHFLFNNLNNLYHKVAPLSEPASEQIQATAALLREIFEDIDATLVPIKKEIDFINNLVLLEKDERFTNLEITFSSIDKPHEEILIAPLLFEAFVSNAFKYVKREKGYINIDLKIENSKILYFSCENNTETIPLPVVSTKNGLLNIRKRLDLLYPNKNRLEIRTGEHLFRVDLMVEL